MANQARRLAAAASLLTALAGCSSSGGGAADAGPPLVTQTGTTVTYTPCAPNTPLAGATLTIGSHSATTAADGTYSIDVPSGTPFTMTVTAPNYIPLIEAEDTVSANYARGDTRMILDQTASFFTAVLPKYTSAGGLLIIELVTTGSCTDLGGTTVAVSPASPNALTQYPAQCATPVSQNTSATNGVFPAANAAVIYNLTPGTVTVTATSPNCTQIPYPYTDSTTGLTYDGTVTTQAGTGTSFTRVFFK